MPRVHGLDSDPRRRPRPRPSGGGSGNGGGGGIFALPTPLQSATAAKTTSPAPGLPRTHAGTAADMGGLDDMEFRGTQTQNEARTRGFSCDGSRPRDAGRGAGSAGSAAAAAHSATGGHASAAAAGAMKPPSAARPGLAAADNSSAARGGMPQKANEGQPPSAESRAATARGATSVPQQPPANAERFQDGMGDDDGDDDSDATALDDGDEGSVDLLAGDSQDNNDEDGGKRKRRDNDNSNGGCNDKARGQQRPSALLSPISPATQTLDRLSHFGSQEGGAELCIHLLKPVADGEGDADGKEGENDGEDAERRRGEAASLANEGATKPRGDDNPSANGHRNGNAGNDGNADSCNREQCIQRLKAYFMSTQNSAAVAKQSSLVAPLVPFCRRCTANATTLATFSQPSQSSAVALPHHGLCPLHPDFYSGGSYEVLNLLVDGTLLGCAACTAHWERGRPDKGLGHIRGCLRRKGKGDGGKKKQTKAGGANGKQPGGGASGKRASNGKKSRRMQPSSPMMPGQWKGTGTRSRPSPSSQSLAASTNGNERRTSTKIPGPFEVGALVCVADRQWPGMNDAGGVARVVAVHAPMDAGNSDGNGDGDARAGRTYDVRYVLDNRTAKGVEEEHVSLHVDYVSPSKDESRVERREENVEDSDDDDDDDEEEKQDGGVAAAGANDASNPNHEASNAHNEAMGDEPPTPECDEEGRPLSAYERQRRRNIRRNEARLRRLGLLGHPSLGATGGGGGGGGQSAPKRKKKKRPRGEEGERRVQPRRTATKPAEPKAKAASSDARREEEGGGSNVEQPQRKQAAKLPASRSASSTREQRPTPSTTLAVGGAPTLLEAAKAGCRKCTREWQTEEADPDANHDICCPRVGKKASSAESQARSGGRAGTAQAAVGRQGASTKRTTASKPARRATPSPVPPASYQPPSKPPSRPPPPLPSWIAAFVAESDRNDEAVPAPRGSKWLPCPNPWGKIGHEEGDFVIISPFQSESEGDLLSIYHRGPNGGVPQRFVANPLEEGSPYHATHRGPERGGYSVLRLRRDRVGLRPWGFTVRLHEFGGACLVDSVEPTSPAEAAEDISGWLGQDLSSGLKLHDMIVCVNGKSVGCMTMPELQIELDVCGPELMLVVSRFDVHESVAGAGDQDATTLEDLAMDWNEIGPGAPLRRKRDSFEEEPTREQLHQQETSQLDMHRGSEREELQSNVAGNEFQASYEDGTAETEVTNAARNKHVVSSEVEPSLTQTSVPASKQHASRPKAAKPGAKRSVSLSEAAESGCKKCQRELRTGLKDSKKHDANCPRKGKSRASKSAQPPSEVDVELGDRSQHEAKKSEPHVEKDDPIDAEQSKAGEASHEQNRKPKALSRYQKQLEELSDDGSDILPKRDNKQITSMLPIGDDPEDDPTCSSVEEEYDGGGDEEPWLGCVCGKTHPSPIKVFWIQCEECDTWHNVAEECVGFDETAAQDLEKWSCWSCEPPVAGLGL